jgi:hypothetical protein
LGNREWEVRASMELFKSEGKLEGDSTEIKGLRSRFLGFILL